jgi:hypothetical protein
MIMAVIWIKKIRNATKFPVEITHTHGLWHPMVNGVRINDNAPFTINANSEADCVECLITWASDGSFMVKGPGGCLRYEIKPHGDKDNLHIYAGNDQREVLNETVGVTGVVLVGTEFSASLNFNDGSVFLDIVKSGFFGDDKATTEQLRNTLNKRKSDLFTELSSSNFTLT